MRKILVVLGFAFFIFVAEFFIGYFLGQNSNVVTIKLRNNTSAQIDSVIINHDEGVQYFKNENPSREVIARFSCTPKKHHYSLKVKLSNNKMLFSSSREMRPGLQIIENVTENGIMQNN